MTRLDQRYETARWRTFWLLMAFALLIGIGVVTVVLPELEDQPEDTTETGATGTNVQEWSASAALAYKETCAQFYLCIGPYKFAML